MQRLQAIYRGMETVRFHCFRTIRQQNVGEHSAGVALLYDFFAGDEATLEGMRAALQHDLAEQKFGDIPAPTKRSMGDVVNGTGDIIAFRHHIHNLEEQYLRDKGFLIDKLSARDAFWVKMADNLDGAMFCAQESAMGNLRMKSIGLTFLEYVNDLTSESAEIERSTDAWRREAEAVLFVGSLLIEGVA